MDYNEFLASKSILSNFNGINLTKPFNPCLFDFQKDIVEWALKKGQAAIFADCGMGKTIMSLEWASHIDGDVLIVAPLSVAQQTIREAIKFGYGDTIEYKRTEKSDRKITITNYEMLDNFSPDEFDGLILDESSIIKGYDSKFKNKLISNWTRVKYRLACTATPSPNDYIELGNHSEFLGCMTDSEMKSMFFVNDMCETAKWRLKGHAVSEFWKWVSSWGVVVRKPSDLGYDDGAFSLPEINFNEHFVKAKVTEGFLIPMVASTLMERNQARRDSVQERCEYAAKMVNESDEPWLVWCNLNAESELLSKLIADGKDVKGSDKPEHKEKMATDFINGDLRVLISKPSIFGFGLNFQHCRNMVFVGLNDSYEQVYQSIRRCWRFGQDKPVNIHFVTAETEGAVLENIKRKEADSIRMVDSMVNQVKQFGLCNEKIANKTEYKPSQKIIKPKFLVKAS